MYEPSLRQRRLAGVTVLSAAAAVALYVLGGAAASRVAGVFAGVAGVAALGVLYIHGQRRDDDQRDGGDGVGETTKRRQREMEAEAGGYGGNGGGG